MGSGSSASSDHRSPDDQNTKKDDWRAKLERAKRLHRPSLDDWGEEELYKTFPAFREQLAEEDNYQSFFLHEAQQVEAQQQTQESSIPVRINGASLRPEDFHRYELESIPAVIKGITLGFDGGRSTTPWPGHQRWQLKNLENDESLLDRMFKCGEDDDGKNIKVKLRHFLNYLYDNKDDSPLYIFDTSFEDDKLGRRILKDYRVPSYFQDDLFSLVSENRRPPYRWWLCGPERSGTCVHIDPLATSAWNTLVVGQKRWVVFPPGIAKSIVKGKGLVRDDEDDEAIQYFMYILPRIKRKAASLRHKPEYKDFCCYEFTQNPGETVFIPNGWWHAVLNLTHTVAITQNFCSPRNFDAVWEKTRTGRKKLAWKWLKQLEIKYPDLAERAKAINAKDDFRMKYDPVEIERREREEQQRKQRRKERKRHKEMAASQPMGGGIKAYSSYQSTPGASMHEESTTSIADLPSSSPRSSTPTKRSRRENDDEHHPTVSPPSSLEGDSSM